MTEDARQILARSLEQLAASGLLGLGVVNTIELEPIRREFESKWHKRKEQVWAQVETTIRSALGEHTYFLRVGDTSYLIALPELPAALAQTRCASVLKELLVFFLGASVQADIIVRNVTAIRGATLVSAPVDLSALPALSAAPPAAAGGPSLDAPVERPLRSAGGPLTVSYEVEHVFRTADRVLTARRIKANVFDVGRARPATPQRLEGLETPSLIELDRETIDYALKLLAQSDHERTAVIVPLNVQTVVSARGRERVLARLDEEPAVARRVFAELTNISPGTPASRISEAVGLLRQRVRGIYVRLSMGAKAAGPLGGVGLNGVVLDTMLWERFDIALAKGVLAYADAARAIASVVIAGPLASEAFIDVCSVAGVTHYTMQSPRAPAASIRHPRGAAMPRRTDGVFQAVFTSRPRFAQHESDRVLDEIVQVSATRNGADFITSLLVMSDTQLVQVLEGDRHAVNATLARIFRDGRHDDMQILRAQSTAERMFPKWSMAALKIDPQRLGLASAAPPPQALDAEAALEMLKAAATMRDSLEFAD